MKLKCGCPKGNQGYSDQYDCYYCKSCNKWLETECGDKECQYCVDRPLRPKKDAKECKSEGVKK